MIRVDDLRCELYCCHCCCMVAVSSVLLVVHDTGVNVAIYVDTLWYVMVLTL